MTKSALVYHELITDKVSYLTITKYRNVPIFKATNKLHKSNTHSTWATSGVYNPSGLQAKLNERSQHHWEIKL
jgi:hypothetical protein